MRSAARDPLPPVDMLRPVRHASEFNGRPSDEFSGEFSAKAAARQAAMMRCPFLIPACRLEGGKPPLSQRLLNKRVQYLATLRDPADRDAVGHGAKSF